jgi:hypothetical protein
MKRFFFLGGGRNRIPDICFVLLSLIIGAVSVSPARADKVGINFVGGSQPRGTPAPIKPAELAGFFQQKFWNNAYEKSGSLSPVGDDENGSSASYTGFSVNWAAFQTNTHPIAPSLGGGSGTEGPPDYRLGLGYLEATANQPATVTFSNIPAQFTGPGRSYSLVVYFTLDNIDFKNHTNGDKVNIFTLKGAKTGEKTICGLQPSGAKPPLAGWVEVPEKSSTDEGEKTPAGNYVVFSHLTDKDITLTATGGFASDGDPRAAINAIQIIP